MRWCCEYVVTTMTGLNIGSFYPFVDSGVQYNYAAQVLIEDVVIAYIPFGLAK